jgi:hypothetical protein
MKTLQEEWIPAHWRNLVGGAVVALSSKGRVIMCGTIDTFTHDRRIVWIYPCDSDHRQMCFLEDAPQVWLPSSAVVQRIS